MNMQSSNLLPALQELPGGKSGRHRSFQEQITGLVNMDRAMYAAEFASAVSFGMWLIFDNRIVMGINIPVMGINVDDGWRDTLTQAHESAFGNYDGTLTEHWHEMVELSRGDMDSFIGELSS